MTLKINKNEIKIIECKTFFKRLMGFMFKRKTIDYGLLFDRCSSIHTFFMFQPIDVVLLDKDNNIIKTYEALKPNRVILPKKQVKKVLELPINSIKYLTSSNLKFIKE